MRVIVINTGTELLLGHVLNTHLTFIAREIFALGLRVDRQLTVPDGATIKEALSASLAAADVVFVTGGLGPTSDDITRELTSELLGLKLRRDPELEAAITERLRTRGFLMTDRILRQADVPEGAIVLPNANGTASGLYLRAHLPQSAEIRHLFLLPGPPRELHPMFKESVLPHLREIVPAGSAVVSRTIRIAGVGESVVEKAVGAQLLALDGIELGYCARPGEVDVRLLGAESALDEAEAILRGAFAASIYTMADENLEEVIVRLLATAKATVTTAESCTGGHLANRLTNVPGASAVFLAGYVTYSNDAKTSALGVDSASIEKDGAVSAEVAQEMAAGALRRASATYALATTGIAGPDGGSADKPVGTVYIALASVDGDKEVQRRRFQTDRESFKHLATNVALEMLRQRLV